jgi:hypothetical protein
LTLAPQLAAFLQKCPFASARELEEHFLTNVPMIGKIPQRELGLNKFSRRWMTHFLSPPKTLAVLKHQQRCHEFCASQKRIILNESQQVTSYGSNIPIRPQKCLHDR